MKIGRQTIYGLYDPHVAVLLDEALRHLEHLRERAVLMPALSMWHKPPAQRTEHHDPDEDHWYRTAPGL